MRIFLATWAEDNQGITLTKCGCRYRLLSYWFLLPQDRQWLRRYVERGFGKPTEEDKDKCESSLSGSGS